jgi:hypothetical protein
MSVNLVDYIKNRHPEIILDNIDSENNEAIGFVFSEGQLVVGYVQKDGTLCKMHEPINISNLSDLHISFIPYTESVGENNLLLTITENGLETNNDQRNKIIQQLITLPKSKSNCKVVYDTDNNEHFVTQNETSMEQIKNIAKEYKEQIAKLETIIQEKDTLMQQIRQFNESFIERVKSTNINIQQVCERYSKEKKTLSTQLDSVYSICEDVELNSYIDTINKLQKELEELNENKLKQVHNSYHKERCIDKLMNEKKQIVQEIKKYNKEWMKWINENEIDKEKCNDARTQLVNEVKILKSKMKELLSEKSDNTLLRQNVKELQSRIDTMTINHLEQLNKKEAQIKQLEQDYIQNKYEYDTQLQALQSRLQNVQKLLTESSNKTYNLDIDSTDFSSCRSIYKNFITLNNIFFKRLEVIKSLQVIIDNELGVFSHLNDLQKNSIKNNFYKAKVAMEKHIQFLNLDKYVNSPYIDLFKSDDSVKTIPGEFCNELSNLLHYWNENKRSYDKENSVIANIYEDLQGATRVYVKIKPNELSEIVRETLIVNNKMIDYTCDNTPKSFGPFYGVFDDKTSIKDLYVGNTENISNDKNNNNEFLNSLIVSESETYPIGLHNSLKQAEEGYSIVLMNYGVTGAGKSFTLFGENGSYGLLQYGFSNLDISNIKVKNIFEQYVHKFDINFASISAKIHNLVGKLPITDLNKFMIDETSEFNDILPQSIDLNNLRNIDIQVLVNILNTYRKSKRRIKMTPFNDNSSRSNLYFIFELTFNTGKKGYVTVIDNAGMESPIDLFHLFIKNVSLESLLAPQPIGGVDTVKKYLLEEWKDNYSAQNVFDIIKEGFYINETINHLKYYLSKKNYKQIKIVMQNSGTKSYSTSKFYVNPIDEERFIKSSNNCLTIPIFKFLDSLNSKESNSKFTKFIMIAALRLETMYCSETLQSLQFLNTII